VMVSQFAIICIIKRETVLVHGVQFSGKQCRVKKGGIDSDSRFVVEKMDRSSIGT